MSEQWVVIGISGVTCGGKSTLAKKLLSALPGSKSICQDDYFFPPDSQNHKVVEALGHLNWEIISALDMDRMRMDVKKILSQNIVENVRKAERGPDCNGIFPHVLILEGFLLLNDELVSSLCDLRYYVTLTKEQCWERRRVRIYDPPDVPGYFEMVVWPEYVKHRDIVLSDSGVKEVDGMKSIDFTLSQVLEDVKSVISRKKLSS